MDYSYKAIVDRVRDDNMQYTGLNWKFTDTPVTKYPNLVAWIDAHSRCDGGFRMVRDAAVISTGVLIGVIVDGVELTDTMIETVSEVTGMSAEWIKAPEMLVTEDHFVPGLLAQSFEDCLHECKRFNTNWLDDSKAVSVYYDLKQGIYPPMVYWDYILYVISRNKRYRAV